jgi:cytochrome c-type biogenesis protein CcmH/NrfG
MSLGCSHQDTKKATTQPAYLDELAARDAARVESVAITNSAMEEYKKKHVDKARELLLQAVQKDDRNAEAWMQLGAIEYEKNNYYESARAFHRASRLMPTRYEPHFNLGTVYETTAQFTEAIESYKKSLEMAPDQIEVMENLARCYIRSNQNLEEAKRLINRVLISEHRPEWRRWLEKEALRLSLMKAVPTTQEAKNAS